MIGTIRTRVSSLHEKISNRGFTGYKWRCRNPQFIGECMNVCELIPAMRPLPNLAYLGVDCVK
jgi:hypothetical protein